MKEKENLKESFGFDYTELTAIAEYLERQEEKGLRLKEFEGKYFVFEKAEPRKIRYSVEIYTALYLQKDFIAACEEDGWEYVDMYNNELYIFRTQSPYATEIMTDENEKFKTIAKRVLLQPGYFSVSLTGLFWYLIHLSSNGFNPIGKYGNLELILTLFWMATICSVVLSIINYLFWLIKGKTAIKKGEKLKFKNLKRVQTKRITRIVLCTFAALAVVLMLWRLDSGYFTSRWIYLLPGSFLVFFGASFFDVIFDADLLIRHEQPSKRTRNILSVFMAVILATGVYGLVLNNKNKAEEVSKTLLDYEGIPISFADYGFDNEFLTDECETHATRFSQYYAFRSNVTTDKDSHYMRYEILVSEYPYIRQMFIKQIEKELDSYYLVQMKNDEKTDWDVYCRGSYNGEFSNVVGYAIKDNVIVYTGFSPEDEDFFEVAYEKLFSEKGKGDVTQ